MAHILEVVENPRPFVKAPDYFGPDRRRRHMAHAGGERRERPAERPADLDQEPADEVTAGERIDGVESVDGG